MGVKPSAWKQRLLQKLELFVWRSVDIIILEFCTVSTTSLSFFFFFFFKVPASYLCAFFSALAAHFQCQDQCGPACRSAAQRPACPLFLFPTCAVRDKACLFSQRLIVPLARWCAWTALISPALSSPGKDFLLVLPLPVRTGSYDERWGATEDRSGGGICHVFWCWQHFFLRPSKARGCVLHCSVHVALCADMLIWKKSCIFLLFFSSQNKMNLNKFWHPLSSCWDKKKCITCMM